MLWMKIIIHCQDADITMYVQPVAFPTVCQHWNYLSVELRGECDRYNYTSSSHFINITQHFKDTVYGKTDLLWCDYTWSKSQLELTFKTHIYSYSIFESVMLLCLIIIQPICSSLMCLHPNIWMTLSVFLLWKSLFLWITNLCFKFLIYKSPCTVHTLLSAQSWGFIYMQQGC